MIIGAQLYTVRAFCRTPEGLAETLKKVADIGYTVVQLSGTCEYEPGWMADQLKRNGLTCVLTHTDSNRISRDPGGVIEAHRTIGCPRIGIGSLPGGADNIEKIDDFIAEFLPIAEKIRNNGLLFMYHNHQIEFGRYRRGMTYFERLAEAFPADCAGFTFDTYWAQVGGVNPAEWLLKLKGRVPCVHLKDLIIYKKEQRMAPIGGGNLNFPAILAAAETAGTEYLLVEQDDCYGNDPFDELAESYRYLRSLGLR